MVKKIESMIFLIPFKYIKSYKEFKNFNDKALQLVLNEKGLDYLRDCLMCIDQLNAKQSRGAGLSRKTHNLENGGSNPSSAIKNDLKDIMAGKSVRRKK